MTSQSTTIRVSCEQRERLRQLAQQRGSSMTDTLDAALESLRRDVFYREMANAESVLRDDADGWARYRADRDTWLTADLS